MRADTAGSIPTTPHPGRGHRTGPAARAVRAAALLAAVAATACATNGGLVRHKVALVIGNSAYSVVSPLTNPVNDAQDMCRTLQGLGFETLCYEQLQRREDFEQVVTGYLNRLGPRTAGVFYYSGHGVQAGGENYLVPTDASVGSPTDNPLTEMYPVGDLFERLRRRPSAFQMIVLDACRSDPFGALPSDAPVNEATASVLSRRVALQRSFEVGARAQYGVAKINDAPIGSIVLFATGSRDTAYDGDSRNGPLTGHFLKAVGQRGLSVEDLLKQVISGVQDETRAKFQRAQTPFTYQSFRGRFCFAGCFDPDDFIVPVTP